MFGGANGGAEFMPRTIRLPSRKETEQYALRQFFEVFEEEFRANKSKFDQLTGQGDVSFEKLKEVKETFFSELENLDKIVLSTQNRSQIFDTCAQYLGRKTSDPGSDALANAKKIMKNIEKCTRQYIDELSQNIELLKAQTSVPLSGDGVRGDRTLARVRTDLETAIENRCNFIEFLGCPIDGFCCEIRQFHAGNLDCLENWDENYCIGSHRPRDRHLDNLIHYLADIFEEAARKPTASWINGSGKATGAFARFLLRIHKALPSDVHAHSDEALIQRAKIVLKARKEGGSQSVLTKMQRSNRGIC